MSFRHILHFLLFWTGTILTLISSRSGIQYIILNTRSEVKVYEMFSRSLYGCYDQY